jgi:hypothetical protein
MRSSVKITQNQAICSALVVWAVVLARKLQVERGFHFKTHYSQLEQRRMQNERLNAEAIKALQRCLENDLRNCFVESGYPKIKNGSEVWGVPSAKLISKTRNKFLSELDGFWILCDPIISLFENVEYKQRPSGKLCEILKDDELKRLIDSIISFIESIPRTYSFYLLLGYSSSSISNLKISEDVEITFVKQGDAFNKISCSTLEMDAFSGQGLISLAGLSRGEIFGRGSVILKVQTSGFARSKLNGSAAINALSKIKCALYLGYLLDIFTHTDLNSSFGKKPGRVFFTDDLKDKVNAEFIELTSDASIYLSGYSLNSILENSVPEDLKLNLGHLTRIFSAIETDENRVPIMTAAEWAFESEANPNQTVSFIQLSIALEAILGDEKTTGGLTKTLADRCAYLLGKTTSQRNSIREMFEKFYNHRSKLVHGRKVRLDKDSEGHLYLGKNFLNKILIREVKFFRPAK